MLTELKDLLSQKEVTSAIELAQSADWLPGADTAGSRAATHKTNQEINTSDPAWKSINELVVPKLYNDSRFQNACLPSRVSSCHISRCTSGMGFGAHTDNPIMGSQGQHYRSDVAITVFLSRPEDYQGGELVVETPFGEHAIKLAAGSAVAYPASSLHRVNPVEAGERLVCVLWAQSFIADALKRELAAELCDARDTLQSTVPDAQVTNSIDRVYCNLVRMWSEV